MAREKGSGSGVVAVRITRKLGLLVVVPLVAAVAAVALGLPLPPTDPWARAEAGVDPGVDAGTPVRAVATAGGPDGRPQVTAEQIVAVVLAAAAAAAPGAATPAADRSPPVPPPSRTTYNGLPVRRPGAQLIPGRVAPSAAPVPAAEDWRDPLAVSEVAAAYSRGLTIGRALPRNRATAAQRNGEQAR